MVRDTSDVQAVQPDRLVHLTSAQPAHLVGTAVGPIDSYGGGRVCAEGMPTGYSPPILPPSP